MRDRLREALDRLREVRDEPDSPGRRREIAKALGDKNNYVVGSAADIVAKESIDGLDDALESAFRRFMENPIKRDPGCKAKLAVIEALRSTSPYATDVFLQGIHHIQLEPAWGKPVDTATSLRSVSAFALVESLHPDALLHVADLLADENAHCRSAATQAAAAAPHTIAAASLLRFKLHIGDREPEVIGHCMDGLLSIARESSFELIAGYLDGPDSILAENAALSLGTTRSPEAFDVLRRWWERTVRLDVRALGLVAISLIRDADSRDFLIEIVARGEEVDALDAVKALELYRHDDEVWAGVEAAAAGNTSAVLAASRSE